MDCQKAHCKKTYPLGGYDIPPAFAIISTEHQVIFFIRKKAAGKYPP